MKKVCVRPHAMMSLPGREFVVVVMYLSVLSHTGFWELVHLGVLGDLSCPKLVSPCLSSCLSVLPFAPTLLCSWPSPLGRRSGGVLGKFGDL